MPKDILELKTLNRTEVEKRLQESLLMTTAQIEVQSKDPEASVIDKLVASIILQGIEKGDHFRLDFLLNRIIGKVKEPLEIFGKDGGPIEVNHNLQSLGIDHLIELYKQKKMAIDISPSHKLESQNQILLTEKDLV